MFFSIELYSLSLAAKIAIFLLFYAQTVLVYVRALNLSLDCDRRAIYMSTRLPCKTKEKDFSLFGVDFSLLLFTIVYMCVFVDCGQSKANSFLTYV